ncbi:MAG: hypothetical protein E8D44_14135 [Nitrospira sp.]|nr:MAG: hypothetical protein E8D44_14135 [Nitrospira sp.]
MDAALQFSGYQSQELAVCLLVLAIVCFVLALPIRKYFRMTKGRQAVEPPRTSAVDQIPYGWEAVSGKSVFEFVSDVATHSATFQLRKKK